MLFTLYWGETFAVAAWLMTASHHTIFLSFAMAVQDSRCPTMSMRPVECIRSTTYCVYHVLVVTPRFHFPRLITWLITSSTKISPHCHSIGQLQNGSPNVWPDAGNVSSPTKIWGGCACVAGWDQQGFVLSAYPSVALLQPINYITHAIRGSCSNKWICQMKCDVYLNWS